MQGDSQVCRYGPGCRCPDDDRYRLALESRYFVIQPVDHGKLDINGWGGFIMVFDFSFGQGGLAATAPVNRFFASVKAAVEPELQTFGGDNRFVAILHGQVRVLPFAHDPQPFEFFPLYINELFSIRPTFATEISLGNLLFPVTHLLVDIMLDGQAMTIPSRYVNSVEPGHLARADNNIFQYLV